MTGGTLFAAYSKSYHARIHKFRAETMLQRESLRLQHLQLRAVGFRLPVHLADDDLQLACPRLCLRFLPFPLATTLH